MASNIIDELIIKLGFDQQGLNKSAAKVESVIGDMAKNLGGILAAVFSADYLKNLITGTAQAGTKLAILSKMTGENVSRLGAFQQAVIRMGGTAEGFNNTITKMKDAIQDVLVTGGTGIGGLLAAVGISARDGQGNVKKYSETLLELADVLKNQDPVHAQFMARKFEIDDGTFLVLSQGRKAVEAQIALMEKQGVMNQKSAEQQFLLKQRIDDVNQRYTMLKYTLADKLLPTTNKFINTFIAVSDNVLPKVSNALGKVQDALGITNDDVVALFAEIALAGGAIATINLIGKAFAFMGLGISGALLPLTTLIVSLKLLEKAWDAAKYSVTHTSEMSAIWAKEKPSVLGQKNSAIVNDEQSKRANEAQQAQDVLNTIFGNDTVAKAQMMKESGGKKNAIGDNGKSFGLYQVQQRTASEIHGRQVSPQELMDPEFNKKTRDMYMAEGLKKSGGDMKGALAYYNGGQGGLDHYKKTGKSYNNYAENIMSNAKRQEIQAQALAAQTPQMNQTKNSTNTANSNSSINIDSVNMHGVNNPNDLVDNLKKYSDPFNLTRATNNFQSGTAS